MACSGVGFGDLETGVGVSADGEHAVEEERSTGKNEFDGEEREGVRISVSELFSAVIVRFYVGDPRSFLDSVLEPLLVWVKWLTIQN
jgi:hypothetical protein